MRQNVALVLLLYKFLERCSRFKLNSYLLKRSITRKFEKRCLVKEFKVETI